ncbi:cell wall-binding repeat-containing protein [Pseudalkalibacillus sp. Hm43]|uniref:cell wall-binding repeat-containing protein n=1 Tax=Pseudalkalibacillus sp. Hm43 TaxID=3450742 RepID=UPI003F421A0B
MIKFTSLVRFFVVSFLVVTALIVHQNEASAAPNSVDRIHGSDRFSTAVQISKTGWPKGANTVLIAEGYGFADALAGAPLAYRMNAPILLTGKDQLSGTTAKEIARLNPSKIIILGGNSAVSGNVEKALKTVGGKSRTVERIGGTSRYDTAAKIASKMGNPSKAVIVYGWNFPDSLSISSYAARNGYPILLTNTNGLPGETKSALKGINDTIVVGGPSVISNNVISQLNGKSPERISGSSRYHTGSKVFDKFYGSSTKAFVTTGKNFADALTGSVLAAKQNAPILLVEQNEIPYEIRKDVRTSRLSKFSVLGGTSAVSHHVINELKIDVDDIISTAKAQKGVPYKWGGTSPSGFDCSGFLNYVYDNNGVNIPRTVSDIWNAGKKVKEPVIGDVVFFETYKSGPSHAGIYLGDGKFIHSSSSNGVTVSEVNSPYYWGPRYLGSKQIF